MYVQMLDIYRKISDIFDIFDIFKNITIFSNHACHEYGTIGIWSIDVILFISYVYVQVDKMELADARWFSSQDARLMLTSQHPEGYFCPPSQAIAHQLIKHSITLMSKL